MLSSFEPYSDPNRYNFRSGGILEKRSSVLRNKSIVRSVIESRCLVEPVIENSWLPLKIPLQEFVMNPCFPKGLSVSQASLR